MHLKITGLKDFGGFAAENGGPGGEIYAINRGAFTSDDSDFYRYIEQLTSLILTPAGIFVNQVHQYLAVLHEDGTGDLFVNDFLIEIEVKAKRDAQKDQVINQRDIADIRRVRFPGISFKNTDKLVHVFTSGWRFGLVFDFTAAGLTSHNPPPSAKPFDADGIQTLIGDLYRYLSFFNVYRLLETENKQFHEMQQDGWFPFIEMLPDEFNSLARAYENKFDFENQVNKILDRFDEARIREITDRWWKNEQFATKRNIIEAGLNAYLQGTAEGYVNCIKNLFSEVEGVLRSIYRADGGEGKVTQQRFLQHIAAKAASTAGSDYSLILARPFLEYLESQAFGNFDVEKGNVPLSRHSSSHGEADYNLYTKSRALQVILILDQLYSFDSSDSTL
ncbi:MAG: hypothetical protein IH963_09685 [Chloroflexi bacterium]|nr:hypothetical protein [Chloroflexota bacterium]